MNFLAPNDLKEEANVYTKDSCFYALVFSHWAIVHPRDVDTMEQIFRVLLFNLPFILHPTPRDQTILKLVNQFTLTTSLLDHALRVHGHPFVSMQRLYQRIAQLKKAGYLRSYPMLLTRENTYFLGKQGADYLDHTLGISPNPRALKPVSGAIQQHEFEITRFWLKWIESCQHIQLPSLEFYRDGVFRVSLGNQKNYIPDGVFITQIRHKKWAFLLEVDRSTQSATGAFAEKLKAFSAFSKNYKKHPMLSAHEVMIMRLMVICKSPERAENLRGVAIKIGLRHQCFFTYQSHYFTRTISQNAKAWHYEKINIVSAPVFRSCGRDPPCSILS